MKLERYYQIRSAVAHDHWEDFDAAVLAAARGLARKHPRLAAVVLLLEPEDILGYSYCCAPHTLREARALRAGNGGAS